MLRAYGDGNLFGEPYGDGPVRVVFLHGWARRGEDFAACAAELAVEGVASVAFDLPGFGSSPLPTVAGGARMYAALVAEALKDVAPGPLVIVGHSFGGRIAVVLAARHPELVGALVLTGAPLVKRTATARSPFVYRLLRGLHERGLLGDRRMESVRQRFGSTDYRNATGVMRGVLVATVNESYEAELTEVLAPVSMLWGANDLDAPLASAERAASLLRCPHRLRVLAGIGHLVPSEAPHELAVAVKETLA